jgi:hypothetical protein
MTASEAGKPAPSAAPNSTVPVPSAVGAGHLATRARVPRPALQGLLALAAYLAVSLVTYAFPLLRHLGVPQIGQDQLDPNFYVWSWRWWPYALSHGLNPLYSRQIGAPGGYSLAWTTPAPAVAALLAPVTVAFGPIVAFNLTMLLAAPVSAWAAFAAARRLTGKFWAALVAGAVYGFSQYEVGHTVSGQANLAVIMLLPILVYLVLLWRDGTLRGWAFVGLMAVVMALEFYVFSEAFLEMTVLGAASLLIGFAVARPAQRQTVARLARLAAVAWVVAFVLAAPYNVYALRHNSAGFVKAIPQHSLNLKGLVIPETGIVLLLIVLALAVLTWSSRLTRLLVIMFALIVVIAIGPAPVIGSTQFRSLPWARLWSLPFARSAEPVRLMLFGYLVLSIIVALWLALPAKNRLLLAAQWITGLAAVAAMVAYILTLPALKVEVAGAPTAVRPPNALPAFISAGLYRDYVRPGEIVAVVSDRGNAGMLFQADTNFYFRIDGGFINAAFNNTTALPAPVERLMHPTPAVERRFLAYVHRARVGTILVEQAWSAPWMRIFAQMGMHGRTVGGVIVYRTSLAGRTL